MFVHSRKETARTAKFLRDTAVEKETITQFVRPDLATREILTVEAGNVRDANLHDLLPLECRERTVSLLKSCSPMTPFRSSFVPQLLLGVLICLRIRSTSKVLKFTTPKIVVGSQDMLQMLGPAQLGKASLSLTIRNFSII